LWIVDNRNRFLQKAIRD